MKTPGEEASRPEASGRGSGAQPPAHGCALCDLCADRHGVSRVFVTGTPYASCTGCGAFTTGRVAIGAPPPAPQAPLPGEVGLAFRSDNCVRCQRMINVTEPIYRGTVPGTVLCAACHDAIGMIGLPDRPVPRVAPADMVTSVLLRRAAQLLKQIEHYHRPSTEVGIIAAELRQRAEMLQRFADLARTGEGGQVCFDCGVLRAIGEVRS